ncbi:MAG: PQQ-binding-like beta-propeller repeat protein, partial [Nitrososphaerota archaeon]|nr:PQQ-binding-like beta-propeller repeat protein [Nitrososphaerota archaeon]
MKILNKKFYFSTISMLLILSFAVSMFALPNADAQEWTKVTPWPFVDALPNPAGVDQSVLINWGLINYLNSVEDGWNVTLQITDPSGKVTNHTGKTWSTGTVGKRFTFAEPGNYTLQTIYSGEKYSYQTANGAWVYRDVQPAESYKYTLEIREDYRKPDHPGHSLPSEYWSRPVDSQLREWYGMMGSWLLARDSRAAPLFVPYNDAPESAHILWSMPIGDNFGGLAGGDSGLTAYETGEAYDGKFANSLIISGVLYYNRYTVDSPLQTVVAVELRTGKILWEKDFNFGSTASANRPSGGQILTFVSQNNRGAWAYLWFTSGTTMYAVNPVTGDLIYTMTNVPSGTIYLGPNGEMLKYRMVNYGTTSNQKWYLQQWNSTHVVNNGTRAGTADAWGTNVRGETYNADRLGWDLNVSAGFTFVPGQATVSTNNQVGSLAGAVQQAAPITVAPEVRAVFGNTSLYGVTLAGVSLEPENKGQTLYSPKTWNAPSEWLDLQSFGWAGHSHTDGVSVLWTKDNTKNYGFNIETGQFLWETESQWPTDGWSSRTSALIAYGKYYTSSTSGILYCYDVYNGSLLWTFSVKDKYTESYHGENWWLIIQFISDGKIYIGHEVHSPTIPITRGAPYVAVDAEKGTLVWEIDGAFRQNHWGGRSIIGDGIIATMDVYDQQIYAIGKGPSATTLTTSNNEVVANTKTVISGTVMDVSPGAVTDEMKLRGNFYNGVPAVSDESMSDWMLYVYKGFAKPFDVVGIGVTVGYTNAAGDWIEIGKTTTDSFGR